jgi:deoxycytidylate deaminase
MNRIHIPDSFNYTSKFEFLTAVVMKSTIFWEITPCSSLKVDISEEHIASIFRVKQDDQDTSMKEGGKPEDGGNMFLRHSVEFQWTTWHYTPRR